MREGPRADSITGPLNGVVVSGMQPTGAVHIGNFLGSLSTWTKLQETQTKDNLFFFLADHHAFSNTLGDSQAPRSPLDVGQWTYDNYCLLLAAGIDPDRCTFFVQSHVPMLCELTWMLSCFVPHHWLNRMHQFKDKETKTSALSLSVYPILMTADVLAFRGRYVPVGLDQVQHIELAQNIASRVNSLVSGRVFEVPLPIASTCPKIMSLQNPTKKMSKSDPEATAKIDLLDPLDSIHWKIKHTFTDALAEVTCDASRKGLLNLATIYGGFTNEDPFDVLRAREGQKISAFKIDLADLLIDRLGGIQANYQRIHSERDYVRSVMLQGQERAVGVAHQTLTHFKKCLTFI
jgi:tryptophanyl-tRNA synthetase